MDFALIITKPIIQMLIGDTPVSGEYSMPYLKGPDLCEISTKFGLSKSYQWGSANQSRWEYLNDLLLYLNQNKRVGDLLSYLFNMNRFSQLKDLGDISSIKTKHKQIVDGAITYINHQLLLSQKELRVINNKFEIVAIGADPVIESPKVQVISTQYIRELPERIKEDLLKKDYDSVITKSRTLLEEVLIYIIEGLTNKPYRSGGKLNKIYQDATAQLNMRQKSDWDDRVNSLLGGMHKILDAISGMRDINSDAHGVGSSRIAINEREAILTANAAMMLAEYWLSVYETKK